VTFSVRNSRIGFLLRAPEYHRVRASAQLEMDFLGTSGSTSESATFTSPVFRIRHMNLKLETPIVDVLVGQYWDLFGYQSIYHPNTVAIQGVPGQIYSRNIQLRVSKTVKTDPVNIDFALAMVRPPQRDAATPQGQGGIRLAVNKWTGMTTAGSTGTGIQPLSFAVTADVRHFAIPELSAAPKNTIGKIGWAVAGDAFIPLIKATKTKRSNALAIQGEYAWGYGDNDFYTDLNGGVTTAPKLPNPNNVTPAPAYTPDFDTGFVSLNADGSVHLIQWQSWLVGLQYALPWFNGKLWVSGNGSHISSNNAALHGAPNAVENGEWWADANIFWDATPAIRLGFEYSWFRTDYADGVQAVNQRAHFGFWYLF
jgi:hypothetical protein